MPGNLGGDLVPGSGWDLVQVTKGSYINVGQRGRPLLLVRAGEESERDSYRKFPSVQTKLDTSSHTRTHTETADKTGGGGEPGFGGGEEGTQ